MSNSAATMLLTLCSTALLMGSMLLFRPDYFASSSGLTRLIGCEVLLAAACHYRKAFFPLVFVCFLVAGTGLPFRVELLQARWIALGIGAVLGVAVFIKTHDQRFKVFHLIALFCVVSAFVSAFASSYPTESLLKAFSLFLLLLYVSMGARTAMNGDPELFFRRLVVGAEILLITTAVLYLGAHWEFLGNPNSLGAVMSILVLPLLLWGYMTARSRPARLRLAVELSVALLLLFSSFARASIAAAVISCFLLSWSAREFGLLLKGIALATVLAICVVLFVPRHTDGPTWNGRGSMVGLFVYKGKPDQGFMASRRGAWEKTWALIHEKPWFGSGFGTSEVSGDMTKLEYAQRHVDSWVVREHGNSYLAIIEWTGLLGVIPFFALVVLVATNASKALLYLRRSYDLSAPAIPAAAIAISGLVHATFEDWLFAVGYYVCVFFWCIVFILSDVMPTTPARYSPSRAVPAPSSPYGVMASLR